MTPESWRMLLQQFRELQRRFDNFLRLGTVVEIDHKKARARVQLGANRTGWLQWFAPAAGEGETEWRPPSKGEQVAVLSPGGDLASGLILPAIYSGQRPPNGDAAGLYRRTFANGDVIEYQSGNANLRISGTLNAEAESIHLKATNISLEAKNLSTKADSTQMQGAVTHSGGDFSSNGVVQHKHKHKVVGIDKYTEDTQ
ncbi:phage baseplate assembly protein V [Microbulbifer sp. PSTR4-B]|uniref:phage baseplate assembly protein V n=1 Tax=unclassified Microbulbifer TaxID=2619833 RepID=UPI00403AF21E